jgi:hypothetical protein
MCRLIAVALVLAAILAPARANISPEPEFGQSLSPRVPNGVAMTAEVVKIVLGRDDVRVEATFDLKNTRDLVWESRIVRCLNRLGRPDEAREAARAAIPALEAFRGVKPRGILPKPRVFQQWIDQLLAFAAGGPAPD